VVKKTPARIMNKRVALLLIIVWIIPVKYEKHV